MNDLDFSHEPGLGYNFYSPVTPDHPGHARMDVVLTAVPTYRHYDPLRACYQVATKQGGVHTLVVHHPWDLGRRYRVCAGRITLYDRHSKEVEAFSLGGDLQLACSEEKTVCGLTSPAPIFPLYTSLDLSMWLTAEIEIMLAHQKAHWDPAHPHDYEEHLAQVDPMQLYACCLNELLKKDGKTHTGSESLDQEGRHFVKSEINRLQGSGRWPQVMCPVEWLFTGAV